MISQLETPDFVFAGGAYTVGTGDIFDIVDAHISGDSISLGNVGLDFRVSSDGAEVGDIAFFELFGKPTIDLGLEPIVFDGFDEISVRLVDFALSAGASSEIIDGVEVSISSPGGEEARGDSVNASGTSILSNLVVNIEEELASITANPIELFDFIPALRPLDVLEEGF